MGQPDCGLNLALNGSGLIWMEQEIVNLIYSDAF